MNERNDILKDIGFWLELSERYFDADTNKEEELALKRFVVSTYAQSEDIDDEAKAVFEEVRATMSLIATGKKGNATTLHTADVRQDAIGNHKRGNIWKWVSGVAAAVALVFLLRGLLSTSGKRTLKSNVGTDICVAYHNGEKITDEKEVLSMMRESWNGIDYQTSDDEAVASQMREMLDIDK